MSYNVTLGTSNTSALFAERLAQAIRRRLASGLTLEQLGDALNVSKPTVWSWLNGVNEPKGRHVVALMALFDASFANEILDGTGCTVLKLEDARRKAEKAQREAEEASAEHARQMGLLRSNVQRTASLTADISRLGAKGGSRGNAG